MKLTFTDNWLKGLRPPKPGHEPPKGFPADGKPITHWDLGSPGLGVRIFPTGTASFFVFKRPAGSTQKVRITLGTYPATSLAQARRKASDAIRDLALGTTPAARKQAARKAAEEKAAASAREQASLFSTVAEDFITKHAAAKRTAKEIESIVRRQMVTRWGDRPIRSIRPGDIITMVEDLDEDSPSSARQAWIYCRKMFTWALQRDAYDLEASPCDRVPIRDLIDPTPSRERILSDAEVVVVHDVAKDAGVFGLLVRLLLLTGARRAEIARLERSEWKPETGIIDLPGTRTKNGTPRSIFLSAAAADLLRQAPRFSAGPFLITTTAGRVPVSGFSKLKRAFDADLERRHPGVVQPWRLHDLRRTARSAMPMLGVSPDLAELWLGHTIKGVRAVYDRYGYAAELRDASERWSAHIAGLPR